MTLSLRLALQPWGSLPHSRNGSSTHLFSFFYFYLYPLHRVIACGIISFSFQIFVFTLGTYQVQTNLSVQTMKTSIWVIRSTSKGRCAERWDGGFAKVCLPNRRGGPDCKIIQSPIPLGCWSNDLDSSFQILHEEVGLHLICSHLGFLCFVQSYTNVGTTKIYADPFSNTRLFQLKVSVTNILERFQLLVSFY